MAIQDFFAQTTRTKITEAIARAEQQTSAEIVVALRKASASYRGAELLFGALCAMTTLILMLFLPMELPLWSFVLDVAIVFAVAAWAARLIPGVQRGLTPNDEVVRSVREAAAAAFLLRGVHRCKARNGVLIYVSVLEAAVEAVADVGIDAASIEPLRKETHAALVAGNVDAFVASIEKLGAALSTAHPRRDDDVNELSDDVDAGDRAPKSTKSS